MNGPVFEKEDKYTCVPDGTFFNEELDESGMLDISSSVKGRDVLWFVLVPNGSSSLDDRSDVMLRFAIKD